MVGGTEWRLLTDDALADLTGPESDAGAALDAVRSRSSDPLSDGTTPQRSPGDDA